MPRSFLGGLLLHWLGNYDDVLNASVSLLYTQIFVGLAGSLNGTDTGVVDADVSVALFGLVAVASAYQSLGRAYAALLACMIVLDAFSVLISGPRLWETSSVRTGSWDVEGITSTLTLTSLLLGLILRSLSAVLWVQMFRLGWSSSSEDFLNSFSGPFGGLFPDTEQPQPSQSPRFSRQLSHSDEFLGSSIFHPQSFAALNQPQLTDYLGEDSVTESHASTEGYEPPAMIPEDDVFIPPDDKDAISTHASDHSSNGSVAYLQHGVGNQIYDTGPSPSPKLTDSHF